MIVEAVVQEAVSEAEPEVVVSEAEPEVVSEVEPMEIEFVFEVLELVEAELGRQLLEFFAPEPLFGYCQDWTDDVNCWTLKKLKHI